MEPTRSRRFQDRELFEPKFGAELRRVASVDPVQVVGKNIAMLMLNGRQILRGANRRRAIAEADRRKAPDIRPVSGTPGIGTGSCDETFWL